MLPIYEAMLPSLKVSFKFIKNLGRLTHPSSLNHILHPHFLLIILPKNQQVPTPRRFKDTEEDECECLLREKGHLSFAIHVWYNLFQLSRFSLFLLSCLFFVSVCTSQMPYFFLCIWVWILRSWMECLVSYL